MGNYRWRWITTLGILAALWAAIELSLGTTLYLLRVPLRGEFLTVLTLPLMFATRSLIPRRGSVLAVGLTAAVVRWLLGGAFAPQVSLAIAVEALLVELGLGPVNGGAIVRWRGALAGALGMGYTAAHPVLFWGLLLGGGKGIELPVGIGGLLFFGAILGLHLIGGAAAGIWARTLLSRLTVPLMKPISDDVERPQ